MTGIDEAGAMRRVATALVLAALTGCSSSTHVSTASRTPTASPSSPESPSVAASTPPPASPAATQRSTERTLVLKPIRLDASHLLVGELHNGQFDRLLLVDARGRSRRLVLPRGLDTDDVVTQAFVAAGRWWLVIAGCGRPVVLFSSTAAGTSWKRHPTSAWQGCHAGDELRVDQLTAAASISQTTLVGEGALTYLSYRGLTHWPAKGVRRAAWTSIALDSDGVEVTSYGFDDDLPSASIRRASRPGAATSVVHLDGGARPVPQSLGNVGDSFGVLGRRGSQVAVHTSRDGLVWHASHPLPRCATCDWWQVAFSSRSTWLVAAKSRQRHLLFLSRDGGSSWTKLAVPGSEHDGYLELTGWSAGRFVVDGWLTLDAGAHWHRLPV